MIEVQLHTALLLFLGMFLFVIFLAGLTTKRRGRQKPPPPLYRLRACEYCQADYLALSDQKVTKCPHCHLLNQDA